MGMTNEDKLESILIGLDFCSGRYEGCGKCPGDLCWSEEAYKVLKAQEPHLITPEDFENADEYGFIPVWCEERDKNCYLDHWECIPRTALETAKEDRCRYWTSKPSLKQMEETPWS